MRKRILFLMLAAAMLLTVFAGCSPAPAKGDKVELQIAFCTWVGYAPLYIAQEQGYFDTYGLSPTLTIIEDESQYAAAMYSNNIQGLGNVLDREVIHFSKGTPEEFAFAMCESLGGDGVVATAEINSVTDLVGKTVGLDKSSTAYFFFLSILEAYGVSEDDIRIEEMGASDAGAAFVAGQIDAAVVWEPWLTNAGQRDGGHVLVSSAEFPKTILDVFAIRSDFAKDHPEAVKGLANAWYDAVDFLKANPERANEIMAAGLGLEVEETAEMVEGVSFLGRVENEDFYTNSTLNIYNVAERAGKFWMDKGVIDQPLDVDTLIPKTYYKG